MPDQEPPFDPSMFTSLDELKAAYPEKAKEFHTTQDGRGFVRNTVQRNPDRAREQAELQLFAEDFLQLYQRYIESDIPDSVRDQIVSAVDRYKEAFGPNFEQLESRSDNGKYRIGELLQQMPILDKDYAELCDIPEEEKQRIIERVADIGTEPDLMGHGTRVFKLDSIESFHGIIARNPRFRKRWKRSDDVSDLTEGNNSGTSLQGHQSISCVDPQYEVELLEDINANRDHKIYAMFIPGEVIAEMPESPVSHKNVRVEQGSELDLALREYLSRMYGCDARIDSIYHVGEFNVVVHGEMTFSPDQARKMLISCRREHDGYADRMTKYYRGYQLPDEDYIQGSTQEELDKKSQPEEIIKHFLGRWGFKDGGTHYSPSTSILIKPTRADIESGKIVRNFGGLLNHTGNGESDWESRIPLNRIVGLIFGKNMNLPTVVNFARKLQIPVYGSNGDVIWPEAISYGAISEKRKEIEGHTND